MRWLTKLRLRLRSLFFPANVDRELDEELGFHLAQLTAKHVASGMAPTEARRLALVEMGGPDQRRDDCREARGLATWQAFTHDTRFAVRSLRRSRGYTAAVVTSLALGLTLVGATSAIGNAYLLKSLPAPAADRLYHVWYDGQPGQVGPRGLSALDWQALTDIVEVADNSIFARYVVTASDFSQGLVGLQVAKEAIDALGLTVVAGRRLGVEDFATGDRPALIGDRLWRERFDGDAAVLGRTFSVTASDGGDLTFRIVGILPPGFRYVRAYARSEIDLVSPYLDAGRVYMVRLREGVTPAATALRITTLIRHMPDVTVSPDWPGVRLESVHDHFAAPIRPLLTTAWLASAFVLLIVAANLSILVLLRSLRRQPEVAVRLALGAGWTHLARAVLAESSLLCASALGISLVLTSWLLSSLTRRIEESLGRVVPGGTEAVSLDWTVFGLVGAGGLAVIVIISLIAMVAIRRHAEIGLRSHGRVGMDRPWVRWARTSLVTLEVGGSIALLVGCGLMVRTAMALLDVDLGLTTAGVVRTGVGLPAGTDTEAHLVFYERLSADVRSRTGAEIAFANWSLFGEPARPQDVEYTGETTATARAAVTAVSDGYFSVLGIAVRDGRGFEPSDRRGAAPVALVSQTLATRLWPEGRAIGQRVRSADRAQAGEPVGPWRTVVGVVGDVRQTPMDEDLADVYVPFLQVPTQFASIMIRSNDPPSTWLRTVRDIVGRIDPRVLVGTPTSLDIERDRLLSGRRLLATLLSGFAGFAAFLTLVGVYGVTAHAVRQREAEVALRLALGATPGQVSRLFLVEISKVIGAGVVAGLIGAAIVGGALESQLHNLSSLDAPTLVVTMAGVTAATLAAAWLPVRRSARLSPAHVLRR